MERKRENKGDTHIYACMCVEYSRRILRNCEQQIHLGK